VPLAELVRRAARERHMLPLWRGRGMVILVGPAKAGANQEKFLLASRASLEVAPALAGDEDARRYFEPVAGRAWGPVGRRLRDLARLAGSRVHVIQSREDTERIGMLRSGGRVRAVFASDPRVPAAWGTRRAFHLTRECSASRSKHKQSGTCRNRK
jgi:hypothetical protein